MTSLLSFRDHKYKKQLVRRPYSSLPPSTLFASTKVPTALPYTLAHPDLADSIGPPAAGGKTVVSRVQNDRRLSATAAGRMGSRQVGADLTRPPFTCLGASRMRTSYHPIKLILLQIRDRSRRRREQEGGISRQARFRADMSDQQGRPMFHQRGAHRSDQPAHDATFTARRRHPQGSDSSVFPACPARPLESIIAHNDHVVCSGERVRCLSRAHGAGPARPRGRTPSAEQDILQPPSRHQRA